MLCYYGPCTAQSLLGRLTTELDTTSSPRQKMKFITQGLDLVIDEANDSISAEFYLRVGITYGILGKADSAKIFLNNSQSHAQNNQHYLKARIYCSLGNVNRIVGDNRAGLEYYETALQQLEGKSDVESEHYKGSVLGNIAGIYFGMEDMDKAEIYTTQALRHATSYNDLEQMAYSYVRLGLIFNRKEEYEKALEFHNNAADLIEQEGIHHLRGYNWINQAKLYSNKGEFSKALNLYNELINGANDDLEVVTISLTNAADIYFKLGDFDKSLAYANRLLKVAHESKTLPTAVEAYQLLYESHQQLDNYKEANQYINQFIVLNDSLKTTESLNALSEFEAKYESEKKDLEITQLKLENQQAANQRNMYLSLSVIVFVAIIFLIILVRSKTKSNCIIKDSLNEKETLLKEIHHRVKNNLQIVSSLLNLQAGHLDDKAAKEAVKEGQNRVKSMALIHQKLYQSDDIRGVEVLDYIENLTHALFASFGVSQEVVEVELDIDQLRLDIDTLIPLGLILNELISNALKYAYPNGEGKLSVNLTKNEDMLLLQVKDNGPGLDAQKLESSISYGWKMIRSLSRKLKADIDIKNESGTVVTLQIKSFKLVA